MKNTLMREWNSLLQIQTSDEIYKIFLRGVQALGAISFFFASIMMVPMMLHPTELAFFGSINPLALATPFIAAVIQIGAAEYSLRCIKCGKFRGVLIGIVLSSITIFSWLFFAGLFGLYCFLNQQFQEKHLTNAPKPFLDFLSALKINYATPTEAKS